MFINQASKSTMNITHYIVGYAHYFCAATGYVCESPGFVRSSTSSSLSLSSISPVAWVLCLVFLAAWYYELDAHKIFANLKIQNSKSHSIPSGSLFKYVSCPHYLCEVIIYTCFMFILGLSHQTGVLGNKRKISKYFETNMILIFTVWFWVLTNQMIAATMSHNWYRMKFKEYPAERKAIIPFIW